LRCNNCKLLPYRPIIFPARLICSASVSYLSVGDYLKNLPGPIFTKFSRLVELCRWTISLKLVYRSVKGRILLVLVRGRGRRQAASGAAGRGNAGLRSASRWCKFEVQIPFLVSRPNSALDALYNVCNFSELSVLSNTIFCSFYRAMLCIRGTSHGPVSVCVCLSVCLCLSQACVLLKPQNVGSHKQHHTIPQGLYFSGAKDLREIRPGSPPTGAPNAGGAGQNLWL